MTALDQKRYARQPRYPAPPAARAHGSEAETPIVRNGSGRRELRVVAIALVLVGRHRSLPLALTYYLMSAAARSIYLRAGLLAGWHLG